MDSLRGQLLVASPALSDPNFNRTVVLVVEHNSDGAMGLVLNRPSETPVGEAVPELSWLPEDADADSVFVGGPVSPGGVMVLAEFDDLEESAAPVLGTIGFVPAEVPDVEAFADSLGRRRVFAGHAGWGPGQLEMEMEEDSWIVEPALPEDVFADDPEHLWPEVLRRKGRQYALLATMPLDPSLN